MNRIEKSVDFKNKGYNCAQAVLLTYCDVLNLDEELASHMTAGFGTGLGNEKGTCGAILGGGCVMGLTFKDKVTAKSHSMEIMNEFEDINKSTICGDLKGTLSGKPLRSCNGCVGDVANIVENILRRENKL